LIVSKQATALNGHCTSGAPRLARLQQIANSIAMPFLMDTLYESK
jgi:hypothetical protein